MDIKSYLEKEQLSQEQFATRLKVTQGLVWQWIDGRTKLTIERVRQIVAATDGQVTPHDLMPSTFPRGFIFPPEPKPERKRAAA